VSVSVFPTVAIAGRISWRAPVPRRRPLEPVRILSIEEVHEDKEQNLFHDLNDGTEGETVSQRGSFGLVSSSEAAIQDSLGAALGLAPRLS
jgi:hypothetical protein